MPQCDVSRVKGAVMVQCHVERYGGVVSLSASMQDIAQLNQWNVSIFSTETRRMIQKNG